MRSKPSRVVLCALFTFSGSVIAQQQKPPEIRRVVTALDTSGKAVATFDSRLALTRSWQRADGVFFRR